MAGTLKYIRFMKAEACSYWSDQTVRSQLTVLGALNFHAPAPAIDDAVIDSVRLARLDGVKRGFLGVQFGVAAATCFPCRACVPLRVNTDKFMLSSSQAKMMAKNSFMFDLVETKSLKSLELYDVFKNYIKERHSAHSSHMRSWDHERFKLWLDMNKHMLIMRDADKGNLVGFSALNGDAECTIMEYIAFDPAYAQISPGKRLWLQTINIMKHVSIPHIYIGAWAKDSPKLGYKKNYSGLETFNGKEWVDFDPAIHTTGPDYKAMIRREGFAVV